MSRTAIFKRSLRLARVAGVMAVVAVGFGQAVRLAGIAGDLDPAFGIGGVAAAPSSQFDCACAVAIQEDGRILAATAQRVVRFNGDGSIDTTFGSGGAGAIIGTGGRAIKVLQRPDGRIAVVAIFDGDTSNPNNPVAIVQYHPDGTLDTGFGSAGIARHVRLPAYDYVTDAAMQADGGIVVSGLAADNIGNVSFTVRRFTSSGTIDPSFGTGGWVATDLFGVDEAFAIAVQADGRILAAGFSDTAPGSHRHMAFVRYMPNGSLDASFGSGGKTFVDPTPGLAVDSWALDLLVQPDGRIVGAGRSISGFSTWGGRVVRLLSDGQLDLSFSGDGRAIYDESTLPASAGDAARGLGTGIAIQPNGRLILGGDGNGVIGVRPDGSLDLDFHSDGVAATPGKPWDMTVQADRKIVIGSGTFAGSGGLRVMRLIADNTPPGLLPVSVNVARGETARVQLGTAVDTSDPFTNLVVAPVAATLPAGVTFTAFSIDAATGAVSALAAAPCTAATGVFDVQFSITDAGNATTFATVPVQVNTAVTPSLSVSDRTQTEANSGTTPAILTLTATGSVCDPITVGYSTANGTASAPSDYVASSGTATIAVGQTSTTISIPVVGDVLGELTETFSVNLTSPVNAVIGDGQGVVTILDTDPPLIQFAEPPTLQVVEQDAPSPAHVVTLKVARLTGIFTTSSVQYFASGTAQNGADYSLLGTGFIRFDPGMSQAEVRIAIVGDLVQEPTETVTVTLLDSGNATIGSPHAVQITIVDDDGVPADVDAPIVTGTVPNPNAAGWHRLDVPVTLTASDGAGSGVQSISYAVNGAAAVVVPSASAALQITDEGITTVSFTARDAQGNVSASQTLTVRLDKSAPSVTIGSPQARPYIVNEAAAAAYACTDGGSGVASCVGTTAAGAAIDTAATGAKSFSVTATDIAGNSASASVAYTVVVPPDVDAPIIAGTMPNPNAAGWHRTDVPITLAASDGAGSGVHSISYAVNGAAPVVVPSASAALQITSEGLTTVSFTARDVQGNVSASQTLTVRLDKTAPGVTIGSPQARAYTVNEAAAAAYACMDGGSGVASCVGTTAAGAAIDTASTGAKSFSATATDLAGNTATATVAYTVVVPPPSFRIRTLYDTLKENNAGSAIPIKLQVENAAGVNVSSSNVIVEALFVSSGTEIGPAEEEALDAGQSNPLGRFRYVSDGAYMFNLKTTGLQTGPYVLVLRVAGDTTLHAVPFLIR